MSTRCNCQRCTLRGLTGPIIVVTLGVLFLLAQLRGGFFEFWRTWPVLLIVIGLIHLASSFASTEGHDAPLAAPAVAPPPPVTPPPPSPSNPYEGQGQ